LGSFKLEIKKGNYHRGDFVLDCSDIVLSGEPPLQKSGIRHCGHAKNTTELTFLDYRQSLFPLRDSRGADEKASNREIACRVESSAVRVETRV